MPPGGAGGIGGGSVSIGVGGVGWVGAAARAVGGGAGVFDEPNPGGTAAPACGG
jgi:hypothetical protein